VSEENVAPTESAEEPAEAEAKKKGNPGCMVVIVLAVLAMAANIVIPMISDALKVDLPHVALAAEKLFYVGPVPVTNTMLATWLTMIVLLVVSFLATRKMKLIPSGLQNVVEMIVEMLQNFVESSAGHHASKLVPVVGTLFLFITVSNWMGLLPGYGSIWIEVGHGEHVEHAHLLRSANTGLNTTMALAVVSVVWTQVFGFRAVGWRFIDRYFPIVPLIQFFRPPAGQKRPGAMELVTRLLNLFPGALEFFAELIKIVSFSFRLFGNIFAGEVLLFVIAFLMPFVASLPFMGLELFVGFIQAFIFATLTVSFSMAAIAHHGDEH
jgi:F-type H+-transporting ATPase subunit a